MKGTSWDPSGGILKDPLTIKVHQPPWLNIETLRNGDVNQKEGDRRDSIPVEMKCRKPLFDLH